MTLMTLEGQRWEVGYRAPGIRRGLLRVCVHRDGQDPELMVRSIHARLTKREQARITYSTPLLLTRCTECRGSGEVTDPATPGRSRCASCTGTGYLGHMSDTSAEHGGRRQ